MNSRILFAVACLGLANAVKLDQVDFEYDTIEVPGLNDMPEMGGDMGGMSDEAIDEAGAYWTGMTGAYTADDGTLFVDYAEEEDDNTLTKTEDGKLEQQTYSWDP